MRLLLVIDHLGVGGAQRQLVNLGVQLHALGHEVEFFTYHPASELRGPLDAAGIRVLHVPKTSRFSTQTPRSLRRQLVAGAYDVALSYLDTPNLYLELAAAGLRRTKIVVSNRAQYPSGKLSAAKRALENCHRLADRVVVNSQAQMQRMIAEFPWLAPRISTIHNGVEQRFFSVQRRVGPAPRRLLVVSTVVPLKNPEGLMDALAICRAGGHDVQVVWAGGHRDAHYMAGLQQRLVKLGLQDSWQWLGQIADVTQPMHECDALVHPSHSEGFPNAICEALAAGMPVLAADVGDHRVLVERSGAGYLFDPARPADIAAALARLLSLSDSEMQRLAENARRFASHNLTMDVCVQRYEALFASLVAGDVACVA